MTQHSPTTPDTRDEALRWLAGRLRWEQLLDELHDAKDGPSAEIVALRDTGTKGERAA